MPELNVGMAASFSDPGRKLIEASGVEVGVFKLGGEFYAYENVCPHIGGPACQGKIIAKVEESVNPDRTSSGMEFSKTKLHVVCPWHGFEFDIKTGRHPGNHRYRLKPIKVRVEDGHVIVSLPEMKQQQNVTVQIKPDGEAIRPEF